MAASEMRPGIAIARNTYRVGIGGLAAIPTGK